MSLPAGPGRASVASMKSMAVHEAYLWIGGSPCSGKSTVAAMLATALGRPLYTCDDHWSDHVARGVAGRLPVLTKLGRLPADVRLRQPLDVQVADVFAAYREEFALMLDDLSAGTGAMVVEGAALLPDLLASLGVPSRSAVWIVPTEEFQRAHYARRPWARDLVAGAPDADALFETWMRRDGAFARSIALQAVDLGYRVITVDGTRPVDAVAAEVSEWVRHSPR
jgi:hypothetical protein